MMVGLVAGGPPACLIRKLRQGIGGIEEWGRVNIEREETVGKKKTDPDRTHSSCVGWFGNFSFTKLSSRDVRIELLKFGFYLLHLLGVNLQQRPTSSE